MMRKLYQRYCNVQIIVAMTFFAAIVVLVFGSSLLRLFDNPLVWADDIAKLLFTWAAFLGADIAFRKSRLVGIDLLTAKLPTRLNHLVQILVHLLMGALLVIFVVFGIRLALSNWNRFFQTIPISYGLVTLGLPVCSIMMLLTCVIRIVRLVKNFGDPSLDLKALEADEDDVTMEDVEPMEEIA